MKENLLDKKGVEYRNWEPFRSKLAACIMNGLEEFPFEEKSSVLYLGVSTGTTISHISDIVGPKGIIFGVEHSSRVARDFLDRVAIYRKNIVPIIKKKLQTKIARFGVEIQKNRPDPTDFKFHPQTKSFKILPMECS